MMLWCTSRSIAAAVVMGSLKIFSHFENGKFLVRMMLVRSKYSCGFPIFDVGVDPGNV